MTLEFKDDSLPSNKPGAPGSVCSNGNSDSNDLSGDARKNCGTEPELEAHEYPEWRNIDQCIDIRIDVEQINFVSPALWICEVPVLALEYHVNCNRQNKR